MPRPVDHTHDPEVRSWVDSANEPETDFPIQNLPFGVFARRSNPAPPRVGVAIGTDVLDLHECAVRGLLDATAAHRVHEALRAPALNQLMALGPPSWGTLRQSLHGLLRAGGTDEGPNRARVAPCLVHARDADLLLPARIGDYTDFYASIFHATNVGRMMRPDNPLLPNYRWVPIGYHGRASSVVVSGTPVRRPWGQTRSEGAERPAFGPSRRVDYELEVGAFIGGGNPLGAPIPVGAAEDHVFGLCLVNDWSARDLQAWEYQPLGPFLAKSFATTISPWAVTLEALAPFRAPQRPRSQDDPGPLPHLDEGDDAGRSGFALTLRVYLTTTRLRENDAPAFELSRGSFTDMYWSIGQLVAHHASNGCNLRTGDLIASGTVSGPDPGSRGCLLELAWRGQAPLALPSGEQRAFLEDGDEVVFRGRCEAPGRRAVGFGECRGRVDAAIAYPASR